MKILCFGDSNTYGFDPRGPFGGRYPGEVRWPDRLAAATGWEVVNCGENGREVPRGDGAYRPLERALRRDGPADALVVMLGTNDLLTMVPPSAPAVAGRMEQFLSRVLSDPALGEAKVLLLSPPAVCVGVGADGASRALGAAYRDLAGLLGVAFADAEAWEVPLGFDGVHFSPEGHARFAERIGKVLRGML